MSFEDLIIAPMLAEDWPAVCAIYEAGIATGNATFETAAPEWADWDAKHRPDCRLVARLVGKIVGWTALSPVSGRRVYAGVVEESVYIAEDAQGQGVGKKLLQAVIAESEQADIWMIQTSIFPENIASIALHKACGFREVGYRERIAQRNSVWRNTVFLERRSRVMDYFNEFVYVLEVFEQIANVYMFDPDNGKLRKTDEPDNEYIH